MDKGSQTIKLLQSILEEAELTGFRNQAEADKYALLDENFVIAVPCDSEGLADLGIPAYSHGGSGNSHKQFSDDILSELHGASIRRELA
jgi:hypothetical protein